MKPFFTIPDPDLTQESSVDPMGLLTLWTALGQQVFGDKLTTIANDVRVFTFNLVHHHLINRLFLENTEEVQRAKGRYKEWRTDFDVKAGIMIFLEDLVTHIFYLSEDGRTMEKGGILGMLKARAVHNRSTQDQILLAASKRKGLLKNQLNLGMTGRYKGPMMNMEYFDRTFSYIPGTWEPVNKMISKWPAALALEDELIKVLLRYVLTSPNRSHPDVSLAQLKANRSWQNLENGYRATFGSRKLPRPIRDYWKDKLGLRSGAPAALYEQMEDLRDEGELKYESIFRNAGRVVDGEVAESLKLQNVLDSEPFFSHAEYLLRYLTQPRVARLADEEKHLGLLRKEIQRVAPQRGVVDQPRFHRLMQASLAEGSIQDWVKAMLKYHDYVMNERGGNSWVTMDDRGLFKHNFGPPLNEAYDTVAKYLKVRPWFHTYYIDTLRSIHHAIEK